ncbi:MAG TPA: hypothetical protein VFQ70_01835 [Candidatus Saccharimonadaceae bacterium]|nr:hypothetical protein [Candidatus Saccharimonadaceae bacterium]
MFGFGRRKKDRSTASTFVEATGGGWSDLPDEVAADGGEHADYVGEMLRRASEYACETGVGIGEEFKFTITDIPRDLVSPHEIVFGLMMRAHEYGLAPGVMHDETAYFTRLE